MSAPHSHSPAVPWPKNVALELTNACDLACQHCHFHGDGVEKERKLGFMSEGMWRTAIEEVQSWGAELTIQPWGMGESLLHPEFWDVVSLIKQSPRTRIGIYTNGMQWDAEDLERAIDLQMDWICFSVDGVRRDVFESRRAGADLDTVVGTVRALAEARRRRGAAKPELRVNMVTYPELEDHVDEFVEYWRGTVDYTMVSRFRPVESRELAPPQPVRTPCYQLDTVLVLGVDGRVAQCCEDPQGRHIVGWFPRQSLAEIWRGEALQSLRQAHREGRWDASSLCADCDGWSAADERPSDAPGLHLRERTVGTIYEYR